MLAHSRAVARSKCQRQWETAHTWEYCTTMHSGRDHTRMPREVWSHGKVLDLNPFQKKNPFAIFWNVKTKLQIDHTCTDPASRPLPKTRSIYKPIQELHNQQVRSLFKTITTYTHANWWSFNRSTLLILIFRSGQCMEISAQRLCCGSP